MVRRLLTALLVMALLLPASALAEGQVIDDAELFTDAQEAQLAEYVSILEDVYPGDFAILTSYDAPEDSSEQFVLVSAFAHHYFTSNGYGAGELGTGMLLLIDMSNGLIYLATEGQMLADLPDDEVDALLADCIPAFLQGDFYGGTYDVLTEVLERLCGDVVTETESAAAETAELSGFDTNAVLLVQAMLVLLQLGGGGIW